MILAILSTLLIALIAWWQVRQGLFSALIMCILSILSAAVAMGLYAPVTSMFIGSFGSGGMYAHSMFLVLLFIVTLGLLRVIFDMAVRANVVFDAIINNIGAGILGAISGMLVVGILTISLQMLPYGRSVITYEPYDVTLQRKDGLWLFYPDRFTLGLTNLLSRGALRTNPPHAIEHQHEDLLLELYASRNTAQKRGRVDAPRGVLGQVTYHVPGNEPWINEVPRSARVAGVSRIVVLHVPVGQEAREPEDAQDEHGNTAREWWYLPATHFHLRANVRDSDRTRSYYPVAYLTQQDGRTTVQANPPVDGHADVADLILQHRRRDGEQATLNTYWVYQIHDDAEPDMLVFRRLVEQRVTAGEGAVATRLAPTAVGSLATRDPVQPSRDFPSGARDRQPAATEEASIGAGFIIGMGVAGIGYVAAFVFGIWFLVIAFKESVMWGLACLFVPVASLVFLITHWDDVKKPFLYQLAAMGLVLLGSFVAAI